MKQLDPEVREYAIKKIEKHKEKISDNNVDRNINILIASLNILASLNYYLCDELILASMHTSMAVLYATLANSSNCNMNKLSKEVNDIEGVLQYYDTNNNIGGIKK